jgi:hypothetical protein
VPGYFADTYALVEVARGNPKYRPYAERGFVTTLFQLFEFYHHAERLLGTERARTLYAGFRPQVIDVLDDWIFAASAFRLKHNRKGFSYADALGYVAADAPGVEFLTGDEAFRGLRNVHLVKA